MKLIGMAYKALKGAMNIKQQYLVQEEKNGGSQIRFYNWPDVPYAYDSLWFYRFVKNCHLLEGSDKTLAFCAVFGDRKVWKHISSDVKVFFIGENVHNPKWSVYADGMLNQSDCNLSLGFDFFEDDRYQRFPLWLTYVFEPQMDKNQIEKSCQMLRYPRDIERRHFASLIARYDILGIRTEMFEAMSNFGRVDCPSGVLHNDDTLKEQFNDNKLEYLRQYLFNICPENTNSYGYVTEKLFQAISSGCIPIYWGSYNAPELKILNQDAIVFWDREDGGTQAIRQVEDLMSNKQRLNEFMHQPRLLPTAEEEVEKMLVGLYDRLKVLIDYND